MSSTKNFQSLERFTCHGFCIITGKYHEQLAILPISMNMAVLKIVGIPESGNRKNPRLLGQVRTRSLMVSEFEVQYGFSESIRFWTDLTLTNQPHVSVLLYNNVEDIIWGENRLIEELLHVLSPFRHPKIKDQLD